MSSPIDLLRQGIQGSNWDSVCDGFRMLTGESLESPVLTRINGDQVLQQISELLSGYFEQEVVTEEEPARKAWAHPALPGEEDGWGPKPTKSKKPSKPPKPKKLKKTEETPETPEAPTVSSRDVPDFHIEHGKEEQDSDPDKGRRCKVMPMDTDVQPNRFKDSKKLAVDSIAESRKLSENFEGKDRRPDYQGVKVICSRCDRKEIVHPQNAPKRLESGDVGTSYICDRCITKVVK